MLKNHLEMDHASEVGDSQKTYNDKARTKYGANIKEYLMGFDRMMGVITYRNNKRYDWIKEQLAIIKNSHIELSRCYASLLERLY